VVVHLRAQRRRQRTRREQLGRGADRQRRYVDAVEVLFARRQAVPTQQQAVHNLAIALSMTGGKGAETPPATALAEAERLRQQARRSLRGAAYTLSLTLLYVVK
jgi:hypothetical protein